MRVAANWAVGVWAVLMTGAAAAWLVLSWGSIDAMAGILGASVCAVLVGAILTIKVPSNWVGPLLLLAGSAWVIYLFGNAYAVASLGDQGPFPGAYLLGWAGAWTGALFGIRGQLADPGLSHGPALRLVACGASSPRRRVFWSPWWERQSFGGSLSRPLWSRNGSARLPATP